MQPVTVSVSAPVILSVLRDREQDDRYRKSGKNGHRQPAGVIPHDSGFIPRIHSIRAPLSHSSDFHPCTSFEQHISPIFIGRAPFFRFQIGFSAKKACFISQETESCRRLCWGVAGQRPCVPWRHCPAVSAPILHWAWPCAFSSPS